MVSLKAKIMMAIKKYTIKRDKNRKNKIAQKKEKTNKQYLEYCKKGICPKCGREIKKDNDYATGYNLNPKIFLICILCHNCGFEYLIEDRYNIYLKELKDKQATQTNK